MIKAKFDRKEYGIEYNTNEPDIISVQDRTGEHYTWYEMSVKKDDELIYGLRKHYIRAIGGAFGLYDFLAGLAITRNADCWGRNVCDWVIANGTCKY